MAQIFSPVKPESEAPSLTQDQVLLEYCQHLRRERGLAAETIHRSRRTAQDLLKKRFGTDSVFWDQMHAGDVTDFLLRRHQLHPTVGLRPRRTQWRYPQ